MSRLPYALATAAVSWVLPVVAEAQAVRLFNDWQAACDNLRACYVLGMAPSDAESYGFIELRREAGAAAEPRVSIAFTFETELQELPLEVAFDPPGGETVFPRDAIARIGRDALLRLDVAPENVASFIAAVRRADSLRVKRLDDAPKDQASTAISLRGAGAALRWVDEQQMRAGGVSALVARGDRPASAIPAPPSPPVVSRASFQSREIQGPAPSEILAMRKAACPEIGEEADGEEIGYQLAQDAVLWQTPCSRGAYNFANIYFLQPRNGAARLIEFAKPENGRIVPGMREIVNGEFNDSDRSIFFFAKSRGLGDCGARGSYVWDGRSFALTEWQEMPTCRGAPLDLWPVLWRADVRGR